MAFSVGIGLTNECDLRCPHCYRPDMVIDRLTFQDIRQVCESIPIRSINLGVGENGLRHCIHYPSWFPIFCNRRSKHCYAVFRESVNKYSIPNNKSAGIINVSS